MKVYNLYYRDCLDSISRQHMGTFASREEAEAARKKDIDNTVNSFAGTMYAGLSQNEDDYEIVECEL